MSAEAEHSLQCMEVWGGNQAVDSSVRLSGLDAWVYSKPFSRAASGGDVYYVSSCATGRITRLLLADVSGHGAAVSNLAVALRQLMRQHVNQLDQVQFVRRLNEQFTLEAKVGSFATALVTTYFAPTCGLSLCNAGHPPPLLYRAKKKSWEYLTNEALPGQTEGPISDVPLGIIDLADYQQFDVALSPGDMVLCYTDSLPEARCNDNSLLGMEALRDVVASVEIGDPATFIPRVVAAITDHCTREMEGDDITLLLFKPNPRSAKVSWGTRLLASFRVIGSSIAALAHGARMPLPEFTIANIGGAMIPSLSRWGRGQKREES